MLDLLIRNALLVDGTGAEAYRADIGIRGEKIVEIASHITQKAVREMDAEGLVASPGFIDVHTHDDLVLCNDPYNMPKLTQGVTTVVVGNCGFGNAPMNPTFQKELVDYSRPILGREIDNHSFATFADFFHFLDKLPKAQNVACLAAHGPMYIALQGFNEKPFTAEETSQICTMTEQAMQNGALGVSFGLMYAPGCNCRQQDMMAIAKIVADYNGIVCIHMKSESDQFEASLQSAAELSRECGVKVEISHLKHVGKNYVGKMASTLSLLEKLQSEGADLSYDMYPYTMGSTTMSILFPTEYLHQGTEWLLEQLQQPEVRQKIASRLKEEWGGEDNLSFLCGWENVLISSVDTEENRPLLGSNMMDIANEWHMSAEEAMMQLFMQEKGNVAILLNHVQLEDMIQTLIFPGVSVISDGLPGAKEPHPRLYGAFPHFLKLFVRERKLLSLEQAIYKMTGQPALRYGLDGRGQLVKNAFADIILFDLEHFQDRATYQQPCQYSEGLYAVIVNGKLVLENGNQTNSFPGKVIPNKERRMKKEK